MFAGRLSPTHVVELTASISYLAADLSLRHGLAMADPILPPSSPRHATERLSISVTQWQICPYDAPYLRTPNL